MGVRQGCMMSSWLYNIFVDGCMREMKAKIENVGARLKMNGIVWLLVSCLFTDGTVFFSE